MTKPMEITIGDYGRFMFESMLKDTPEQMGTHWASIRVKAEPLVRELLRLNSEMKPDGYRLIGYKDESGKIHLSDHQRVRKAQEQLWGVKAGELTDNDWLWLHDDSDYEMHIGEHQPCRIEYIKNDTIGVNVDIRGHDVIIKVSKNTLVLKAPADWEAKEDVYNSWEYWLEQADKLGI